MVYPESEGTHKNHWSLTSDPSQDNLKSHSMPLEALSKHSLNSVCLGNVSSSLESPFQCQANWVKAFFLISNLNFPWHNSGTHIMSLITKRRDQCLTLLFPLQGSRNCDEISKEDNYLVRPVSKMTDFRIQISLVLKWNSVFYSITKGNFAYQFLWN